MPRLCVSDMKGSWLVFSGLVFSGLWYEIIIYLDVRDLTLPRILSAVVTDSVIYWLWSLPALFYLALSSAHPALVDFRRILLCSTLFRYIFLIRVCERHGTRVNTSKQTSTQGHHQCSRLPHHYQVRSMNFTLVCSPPSPSCRHPLEAY